MFKKVLIPVDVEVPAQAHQLLVAAKKLTAGWACELHVTTVIPSVGMAIVGTYLDGDFEARRREAVIGQLADAVTAAGIKADQHVQTGTIYDSVIELASNLGADLIILGAHQPNVRDYLLGSNAARVVRHSKQSVLVLRDEALLTD